MCFLTAFVTLELVNLAVLASSEGNIAQLLRYYNPSNGDHFYTTDWTVIGTLTPSVIGNDGYKYEGIVGGVFTGSRQEFTKKTKKIHEHQAC